MIGALNAVAIRGVMLNVQHYRLVDPVRGIVFGSCGQPYKASGNGYVRVKHRRRRNGCMYAHRLIWETAKGPIPAGHHIDHKNGRKSDNRLSNLEPVLPRENSRRAIRTGLMSTGEQRSNSKLTAVQVCEIRRTKRTVTGAEWARRLEVDRSTVNAVRRRRSWRHIVCHRDGGASARVDCKVPITRRHRRRKPRSPE